MKFNPDTLSSHICSNIDLLSASSVQNAWYLVRALILSWSKKKKKSKKQSKTKTLEKFQMPGHLPYFTCKILRKFSTVFLSGFVIFILLPTNTRVPNAPRSQLLIFLVFWVLATLVSENQHLLRVSVSLFPVTNNVVPTLSTYWPF